MFDLLEFHIRPYHLRIGSHGQPLLTRALRYVPVYRKYNCVSSTFDIALQHSVSMQPMLHRNRCSCQSIRRKRSTQEEERQRAQRSEARKARWRAVAASAPPQLSSALHCDSVTV